MSYDFLLFEADSDPGNARTSKSHLTERADFAATKHTPLLDSLAQGLVSAAPAELNVAADDVQLSGDRCLYMATSYNQAKDAARWLTEIAVDYGLGLADMNADVIIAFGDEDPDAVVQREHWLSTGFSRWGLPHQLAEVLRLQTGTTPYLRVTRTADDGFFIQTLFRPDQKNWLVEYRDGSDDKFFQTEVASAKDLSTMITNWFDRNPDFGAQYDWIPVKL